jgi:hypothetical protein
LVLTLSKMNNLLSLTGTLVNIYCGSQKPDLTTITESTP